MSASGTTSKGAAMGVATVTFRRGRQLVPWALVTIPMLVLMLYVVLAAASCGSGSGHPPSDAEMTQYFQQHRGDLTAMVAAFQSDAATEVVRLSKLLDVTDIDHWQGQVLITRSSSRGGERDSCAAEKGYVYTLSAPQPIVASDTESVGVATDPVYRALGGGWYIYYRPPA